MLILVWPLVELISLFFGKEFNFRIMLAFDSNGQTRKELELNSIILSLILNRSQQGERNSLVTDFRLLKVVD